MLGTMQSGDTRRVNVYAQLARQRPTVIEQALNVTAVYAVDEATAYQNSDQAPKFLSVAVRPSL